MNSCCQKSPNCVWLCTTKHWSVKVMHVSIRCAHAMCIWNCVCPQPHSNNSQSSIATSTCARSLHKICTTPSTSLLSSPPAWFARTGLWLGTGAVRTARQLPHTDTQSPRKGVEARSLDPRSSHKISLGNLASRQLALPHDGSRSPVPRREHTLQDLLHVDALGRVRPPALRDDLAQPVVGQLRTVAADHLEPDRHG